MKDQPAFGCAKSRLLPLENSTSKNLSQRILTNSGTSSALQSSYENCDAPTRSKITFFSLDKVKTTDTSKPLPGEIQSILQASEPSEPPSTHNTISVRFSYQGRKNNAKASSEEQCIDSPVVAVFGPETAEWIMEKFPTLRK
jgi:hypothetical protein